MKVAIVGIGDIAQKAYLPIIMRRPDLEPYLVTRNAEVLRTVGANYRVPKDHQLAHIDALWNLGIEAAFVHAATDAHAEILTALLSHGIHIYVDKPLADSWAVSRNLADSAKHAGRILMVGFNRRYAPAYQAVKRNLPNPHTVIVQKHRAGSPQGLRHVIFDDFIHVLDTLRFLAPPSTQQLDVQGTWAPDGLLASVVVHMKTMGFSGLGAMNRMNGVDEETLEAMGHGAKWSVREMREVVHRHDGITEVDSWAAAGDIKGFAAIIDAFVTVVRHGDAAKADKILADALATHELAEHVVKALDRQG